MKKIIYCVGIIFTFLFGIYSQDIRTIEIPKLKAAPILDGNLKNDWIGAARMELDALLPHKKVENKTVIYLGYFNGKMYVAAECFEKNMDELRTLFKNPEEHDNSIWQDDCIELFLYPYCPDEGNYYQIIINSLGITYDAYGSDTSWESGIRVANGKYSDRWILEMELPFKPMGYTIKGGEFCYINIGREQKPSGELSTIVKGSKRFQKKESFVGARFIPEYEQQDKEVFEQGWWRIENGQSVLRISMRDRTKKLRQFRAEMVIEAEGKKYFCGNSTFNIKPGIWINRFGLKYSRPEKECVAFVKVIDTQDNREVYNSEFMLPTRIKSEKKRVRSVTKPLFRELIGSTPPGLAKHGFLGWFSTWNKDNMRTFAKQYGMEYIYENEFVEMAKNKKITIFTSTTLKSLAPMLRKHGAKACLHAKILHCFFDDDYNDRIIKKIDEMKEYRDLILAIMLEDEGVEKARNKGISLLKKGNKQLEKVNMEVKEKYGNGKYGMPEGLNDTDPQRWIAYNAWLNDRMLAISRNVKEYMKKEYPGTMRVSYDPQCYSNILDYGDFANSVDVFTGQLYPVNNDELSSFGFYTKVFADLTGSKEIWPCPHIGEYALSYTPKETLDLLSEVVRNGGTGLHYYLTDIKGRRKGSKCLHTERYGAHERFGVEMKIAEKLGKMSRLNFPKADCGLFYPIDTIRSTHFRNISKENIKAYMLLGPYAGIWFKFLSDATLKRAIVSLDGYKVIFLPDARYVRGETVKILEKYVSNGGVLVALSPKAFSYDNFGNDTSNLREQLFGVNVGNDLSRKKMEWGNPVSTFHVNTHNISLLPGTKTLLAFKDGTPALTEKEYGKGKCLLFTFETYSKQLLKNKNWRKTFAAFCSSLGLKIKCDIWRFAFPETMIPRRSVPEGKCLTGNYIQWRQFKPITDYNLKTDGIYSYSLAPDMIADQGGSENIPFQNGDLTDRLNAPVAGNVELNKGKSINDWIVGWKKTDAFNIYVDFRKTFPVDKVRIAFSGCLPSVKIEYSIDGQNWQNSLFPATRDNNRFKDDVRLKTFKLPEKTVARFVRITFEKRPDNEKLILAEIDIWE